MTAQGVKAKLQDIQSFRALFLQETNFQIRYDACHERGWTDSYLLKIDDVAVGYGSIKGQQRADRDTIFEFYVIRPFHPTGGEEGVLPGRQGSSRSLRTRGTASRAILISRLEGLWISVDGQGQGRNPEPEFAGDC